MNSDETIRDLAQVLQGLQVPMSMGMPLGTATEPWRRLHHEVGPGWHDTDQIESKLRELLNLQPAGENDG